MTISKPKIKALIQTGYECTNCNCTTVVENADPVPAACENCTMAGTLKLEWKQKIKTITTVEHL